MELIGDICKHLLLDAALFFVLWMLLMRSRRRLRRWPVFTQYRYAHRGLHDLSAGVPENSMAAFRRAVEQGCAVELDVHLTADGRLAVIHDGDLRRTCGVGGAVEDLTAQQLRRCRLFGTEETVPMLEDVLPLFQEGPPLLIELKASGNATALADAFCRTIADFRGDFLVESFDPRVLYCLRLRRPEYIRGQLARNFFKDPPAHPIAAFFLTNLCFNWLSKPDFIAYRHTDRQALSLRICKKLYGVREFSWTIRDVGTLQAVEADGAVAIFEGFIPK